MKLLMTAFEPFNNQKENSSLEVVKNFTDFNIKTLPVFYQKEIYEKLLIEEKPDILLLCGQAGGRKEISIEQIAVNYLYAKAPDNKGAIKLGEKIIEDGDDAFFATIPTIKLVQYLEDSYPVKLSLSAGGYICNMSFYLSLYYAKKNQLKTQIGFIHFPFYDGQYDTSGYPTLPLDIQVKTLAEIIKVLKLQ